MAETTEPPALPVRGKGGVARPLILIFGFVGVFLHINQIYNLQFFVGHLMIDTSYYYILVALFLSLVFVIYPARKDAAHRIPLYDWALFAAAILSAAYLAWNGERIIQEGWDILAPTGATIVAGLVCLLALEAVRRIGGWILFSICGFFFLYPLFAEQMPGFMWGPQSPFEEVVRVHAMGTESIIGVPMRAVSSILIGFLVFGSALAITGGGEFFMSFATALMGTTRGGPAKVAVLSSGFFGSLSGSVISNVVTTGKLPITTMRRTGYPPTYAASVEACASTGGALMPPVMGVVAFIMAEILNISYATVVIAALVPAVLFYLALLLQADNFAARNGLVGQDRSEIPKLGAVLADGWHFLFSLAVLIYLLIWVGVESQAPYYATLVLLLSSAVMSRLAPGRIPFRPVKLLDLLDDAARNIANIVGILVGIGMIVGALSFTGVGPAFSSELVLLAGDDVLLLLAMGAITSFVLGMGMTVSACYIFLAIVLGPALQEAGLNVIASHLFILYWGMLSYITPPVALAAVAASTISGSNALRTGFMAMRMGIINFILPFLFVLTPTLILEGDFFDILHDTGTAIVAVWLMAAGFEGWLYGVGRIEWPLRLPLLGAAAAFLFPGLESDAAGLAILAAVFAAGRFLKSPAKSGGSG